ncbi:ATP-binding cassette domain-containing protein [Bacillus mesophilum]|uniref:ATP-binding cassette domain-containing protein n=1 Tax=Bacillus mesophilum TaxID=1071718 RepID=A0A7V7RJ21_9BACI|nr:ATP-binding cassette domain-containing protein [Bacillus mesophilum]KAB2330585.1 ATP-binding cassette domain-containing protein [Bacillus mesophilum]
MISVQNVTGGYANQFFIQNVTFEVEKGKLFGIIGPNGSGKTTLLKMLSGVHKVAAGDIFIKGKSLESYSPKELAKVTAVLSQHSEDHFSYSVKETVSLGRYAHQRGWFQTLSDKDEQIVTEAMELTGISRYADEQLQHLSGGERQRVFLAQALAQEPEILLLDEPTNHLDLSFQKDLLDMLQALTKKQGLTVISIFHDLNLAGLYCDQLLLMDDGYLLKNDVPYRVLREEVISSVYDTEIKKQPHPYVPAPQLVLLSEGMQGESNSGKIGSEQLTIEQNQFSLQSPFYLKTISSGESGSGIGWHRSFVNWHTNENQSPIKGTAEMEAYLKAQGFEAGETVGMISAGKPEDASYSLYEGEGFSVFTVVIADVSIEHGINTWIFINGMFSDDVYIQSIITATEAKVKALEQFHDFDMQNDCILIAGTQRGERLTSAARKSPLGKLISQGIYECTTNAMVENIKRINGRFC